MSDAIDMSRLDDLARRHRGVGHYFHRRGYREKGDSEELVAFGIEVLLKHLDERLTNQLPPPSVCLNKSSSLD